MRTFTVVQRGKKYWVEAVEDGAHRMVVGFTTEEAATMCLRELQRQEGREGGT
jgi:hypothetical protein